MSQEIDTDPGGAQAGRLLKEAAAQVSRNASKSSSIID